jgi:hypothetical protein
MRPTLVLKVVAERVVHTSVTPWIWRRSASVNRMPSETWQGRDLAVPTIEIGVGYGGAVEHAWADRGQAIAGGASSGPEG